MDYLDYKVEDFLMDQTFCNYCIRKEQKHVEYWEQWVRSHPEKAELVRQAKDLYFMLNGNHTAKKYERDLVRFREKFEQHLVVKEVQRTPTVTLPVVRSGRKHFLSYYMGMAAAAVFAITFVLLERHVQPAGTHLREKSFTSTSSVGERRTIHLPDGTVVLLNSASKIAVIAGFGDSARQVNLEGEAYFNVARDPQHPFVIHTAAMDIQVLGTTFNVKAYPQDAVSEAALISGSVEVLIKDGANRKILLRPDEKISIPNPELAVAPAFKAGISAQKLHVLSIEKLITPPTDSLPVEISWTLNCLSFSDKPLEEIAVQLERWYNVSIRFGDEQVKQYRYTATFDKKTIAQVLKALAISRSFVYYWEGEGKIVIRSSAMKN